MSAPACAAGPKIGRAIAIELAVIAVVIAGLEVRAMLEPEPEPKQEAAKPNDEPVPEARIEVVRVEKIEAAKEPPRERPKPDQPKPLVAEARPPKPRDEQPKREAADARPPKPRDEQPKPEAAEARPPKPRDEQPKPEAAEARPPKPRDEQPKPEAAEAPPERAAPVLPSPAPRTAPRQSIAAEKSDVAGVPLRVLIPSTPRDLESHLRRSGGCLLVSQLAGDRAEILESFTLDGGHAKSAGHRACNGIPRLVRDAALAHAIDDPISQTRSRLRTAGLAADNLVLQVVLDPTLEASAEAAARQKLGTADPRELARRAAAAGYAVRCYAQPNGSFACI